ncbi:MAG: InlB B-repeat-containing protein, partial [Bacilli bacterium]|nr:InlB B-repeat-containing protein [Bacilli bacterium]
GIQTIKDLDLEHQEYKIQLVVTYVVGTTAKNVKSEIITVGTNNPIISHNITYNLDGGTNNELNPSSYVEGEEVILKEATKEGYKFIGWYIGETKVTSISPEAKEDIELTAKWEKIKEKYQITYILNGGTNNASNPSTYEEGETVILKEATKEGYKFLGWYKDGELVTEVKEGKVTVEARFEEIKNQDSEKKGCNCKKTIEMVITLTSAVTLLAFVLRKKH